MSRQVLRGRLIGVVATLACVLTLTIPAAARAESDLPAPARAASTIGVWAGKDEAGLPDANGVARLGAQWARERGVTVGSVLVYERSATAPNGVFARVEKLDRHGDDVLATTRPASLAEALSGLNEDERAKVEAGPLTGEARAVDARVIDPDVARALAPTNAERSATPERVRAITGEDKPAPRLPGLNIHKPFGKDFTLGFNKTITKDSCTDGTFSGAGEDPIECSWEGEGTGHAQISLSIGANGELVLESEGLKITEASLTGGANFQATTDLSVDGPLKGHATWKLADLIFPIVIPAGPIPLTVNVSVTPTLTLSLDGKGHGKATIGGIDASYTKMGVRYTKDGGFELLKGEPSKTVTKPGMSGDGDLSARLDVLPTIGVDLMGLLGVEAAIGAHANVDLHFSEVNPICLLGFGTQGTVGLKKIAISKIPLIGWMLGGLEKKLTEFLDKKATYRWDVPALYTSPNLCAARPIAIGDLVWIDLDGDGIQDEGEPGLAGAKVLLLRGVDKLVANHPDSERYAKRFVAETVTGPDGRYRFDSDPAYADREIEGEGVVNAGKLMPGEYTVVVFPPDPAAADYPYAHKYPDGFTITKRYVRSTSGGVRHTLEDIQKDSGGKYAWNTNSHSSLFDGTRFQDRAPLSFTGANPDDADRLAAFKAELEATGGYNDTVDFGFVPVTVTDKPEPEPTDKPSTDPTDKPDPEPTDKPDPEPTDKPNPEPTDKPSTDPTDKPDPEPTDKPNPEPTDKPDPEPTDKPDPEPTDKPEPEPTDKPTGRPQQPQPNDTSVQPAHGPRTEASASPSSLARTGASSAAVALVAAALIGMGASVKASRRA